MNNVFVSPGVIFSDDPGGVPFALTSILGTAMDAVTAII